MEKDTLLQTLKKNSTSFKLSEIEEMMNEELNKDPNKMDTELVDLCAEILESAYFEKSENKQDFDTNESKNLKKSKKIKFGKLIMIAAIIIIICAITIPVGAKFIHTDASENIVQFFNNQFHINLKNSNTNSLNNSDSNSELAKNIQTAGIENVILPTEFLTNTYSTEITRIDKNESFDTVEIDFDNKNQDISGYISIVKYKSEDSMFLLGQGDLAEEYDSVKQITVNNMDILVFSGSIGCYIKYTNYDTEYDIVFDEGCTFEQAIEVAESINTK